MDKFYNPPQSQANMQTITEGKAIIKAPLPEKISADMEVFYNPIMKFNRDISIALLNALNKKDMKIALPLAASGVRAVRFSKELNTGIIKEIRVNDLRENAVDLIRKNIETNNVENIVVDNRDANIFLLDNIFFDYIDIDPFGTPIPFIDAAIKKIKHKGILAITATDTAALTGTYPKATKRKYFANSKKCPLMHEIGIRILIQAVQKIGAIYEKALTPLYSYFKDHYYRVYFEVNKGKQKVDKILDQHKYIDYNDNTCEFKLTNEEQIGPLWIGKLKDKSLANKIAKIQNDKFTQQIADELDIPFFYDLHTIAKKYRVTLKPMEKFLKKSTKTHFNLHAIKTKYPLKEVLNIFNSD